MTSKVDPILIFFFFKNNFPKEGLDFGRNRRKLNRLIGKGRARRREERAEKKEGTGKRLEDGRFKCGIPNERGDYGDFEGG